MAEPDAIIITGAASGIGRASAEALAARGQPLALVDVNAAMLHQAVESCRSGCGPCAATAPMNDWISPASGASA